MATKKINVKVETGGARWWVVIEPAGRRLSSPKKELEISVSEGVKHAVVYYCEGDSKATNLKITVTSGDRELAKVDRPLAAKKLAYGHKGFTP